VGRILHFGCDIFGRAPEKVLALRARDIEAAPDVARTLTGAIATAARYMEESRGRQEIAAMLARPDRVSVDARLIQRTLVGELKIAAHETRANPNYLILGEGGALSPTRRMRYGFTRNCCAGGTSGFVHGARRRGDARFPS
jgi:NitT/TauT family transport system ATP-binding protein